MPTSTTPLEQAAGGLRRAALASGIAAALIGLAAALAGLGLFPFDTLRTVVLFRAAGPADAAALIALLGALLNLALLLVVMVGVTARELWAPPALAVLLVLNAAALIGFGFTPALIALTGAGWAGLILLRQLRQFRVNPVMLKELRGRMRGARAFLVLTVYLSLMSAFTLLLYLIYQTSAGGSSAAAGEIGRVLFVGVVGIQLLLIVFIAPAFTAGAITGERELQTYDLLQTTLLTPPSFVFGKLESALGYLFLLLLAGIPLQSIAFLFGGVSEIELVLAFIILGVTAVALGTVGLYFSARMDRTLAASVRAYSVIVALMFIGPLALSFALEIVRGLLTLTLTTPPALEAAFVYAGAVLTSLNPLATALTTQQLLIERGALGVWSYTLTGSGTLIPLISPWIPFTILYLSLSALLIVLAIRRLRRVEL